jgi:transcriptional regulator with XRE-family HTH domain
MLTAPENEPLAIKTGKRLRELRKARGMPLRQLAEKMCTTAQTLSRLENAEMTLSVAWIEKLCDALEIQPAMLFNDATFNRQLDQDALCSKVLTLHFEMQRTAGSMAEFLKANGWPS